MKYILLVLILLLSVGCFAADNVNLDLKNVSAQVAIETLFKSSEKNYVVGNTTNNIITVFIKDVPFDAALKNILKAAGMTYRLDGDTYMFDTKPAIVVNQTIAPVVVSPVVEIPKAKVSTMEKVTLYYASPTEILDYIGIGNNNSNYNNSNNNNNYNNNSNSRNNRNR